jgi:hypothetical protein
MTTKEPAQWKTCQLPPLVPSSLCVDPFIMTLIILIVQCTFCSLSSMTCSALTGGLPNLPGMVLMKLSPDLYYLFF